MALGDIPECSSCKVKDSIIWNRGSDNEVLCSTCFQASKQSTDPKETTNGKKTEKSENSILKKDNILSSKSGIEEENDDKEVNKGTDKREYKRKTRKGKATSKTNVPRGKSRRYIFKKHATKSPVAVSTPVTSEYVFHEGMYYQVGDVVSAIDVDGGIYYAQIRGLLQDQYCEKSAVITWLLPTKGSPPPEQKFDPSTYIIGPEEDVPRKLEFLHFVCHAPSDYYFDKNSPYATCSTKPQSCFVWSKMRPAIKPIEHMKEIMNK